MQTTIRTSPEWFTAASKSLKLIHDNASDYEDEESGDEAPSEEVFPCGRVFFENALGERV